jgi:hypothetical protein
MKAGFTIIRQFASVTVGFGPPKMFVTSVGTDARSPILSNKEMLCSKLKKEKTKTTRK